MSTLRTCLLTLLLAPGTVAAMERDNWTGAQIMQAAQVRHQQFPYVYEEQSIVLVDRNGARDTRTARRYSRIEADGTVRLLVVFETPPTVRGVALLATRAPGGAMTQHIYLPALGPQLIAGDVSGQDGGFMGTDFTVESLTGELLTAYRYARGDDIEIGNQACYTVDVYPAGADPDATDPLRRHFVRQDNFFILRTDYFDARGEVSRRLRAYDLKLVDQASWHANLLLMDDYREQHQTLIKVDRRIFSDNYVPSEVFTTGWLFGTYPAPPDAEPGVETTPVASRGQQP